MLNRRRFLQAVSVCLVAAPVRAEAQPVLKRVAAVAGDAIGLDGGGAIVNGSG